MPVPKLKSHDLGSAAIVAGILKTCCKYPFPAPLVKWPLSGHNLRTTCKDVCHPFYVEIECLYYDLHILKFYVSKTIHFYPFFPSRGFSIALLFFFHFSTICRDISQFQDTPHLVLVSGFGSIGCLVYLASLPPPNF